MRHLYIHKDGGNFHANPNLGIQTTVVLMAQYATSK